MASPNKKVVVLGAGISGLTVANKLASNNFSVNIIEKNKSVGGICASFSYKNFRLDYGPHKFYTTLNGIYEDFFEHTNNNYLKIKKKNSLHLIGKNFDFPVKISQLLLNINPFLAIKCGSGVGYQILKKTVAQRNPSNYEEYFIEGFGKTGYDLLFRDYAWKIWGNPKELDAELARKRIPVSGAISLIKSVLIKKDKNPKISAEYFYYPKYGFGILTDTLADKIKKNKGSFFLDSFPHKIFIKDNRVTEVVINEAGKEKNIKTDYLVSSIPLADLVNIIHPKPPEEILYSAKKLKYRSIIIFYIIVNKEKILSDNWIFFPEKEFLFNRISDHKSFSNYTCPPGKNVLTVEITCTKKDETYNLNDALLFSRIIDSRN
ncbi:MAG: NAD(P)-binding protein [Nanoarchaeota archaeon]